MAFQSIWYFSQLSTKVIDSLVEDFTEQFDPMMDDSRLMGDALNKDKRNSKNAWVPSEHWSGGFVWHYVERANRENFLYDIRNIDGESMQYTQYGEGEFYNWHNDAGISCAYKPVSVGNRSDGLASDFLNENIELVRKLSFVVQLSDPEDYEGGNLQLLDEAGKSYFAPRQRGTVIVFDSRTQHRVLKVTKGLRKSLVGWVVGPRWK
jgi:Rps23 Pro-64 3,4-dihydroxylase Tpa1-like proline 4-hydroxylase|tara:strand:+ start:140 stop:760 length:621 start_codon:yes stop_codon:yes gene_type:complete